MNDIKKILIPLELDKTSEGTLEYGITLAKKIKASIKVVHISRPMNDEMMYIAEVEYEYGQSIGSDAYADPPMDIGELMEKNMEKLNDLIERVEKKMHLKDYPMEVDVVPNFALSGIIEESTKYDADLIIMGAHVNYKKHKKGITSLSKDVIKNASVPTLVIPDTFDGRVLDHVCMFTSFELDEISTFYKMIDFAKSHKLKLSLVHIALKGEDVSKAEINMDSYKKLGAKEGMKNITYKIFKTDTKDVIAQLVDKLGADLMILRHKRRFWNLFGLMHSMESEVLSEVTVPIYVWK